MKASTLFLLTLIAFATGVVPAAAQHLSAQPSPAAQGAQSSNALEEQAFRVLEDVVANTPTLKLPQNRSRLQITAADLLWERDRARARSLFSDAAANIVELEKQTRRSSERELDQNQSPAQLRQELILTAARRDAALAYELLQKTQQKKAGTPDGRVPEDETYLEQLLLTQTMSTDPDLALRKAEAMLDRGEYSVTIISVLEKFQEQNKPGLSEESLGRYRQLLENVVAAALKATPKQQDNARNLLLSLRPLLPQIEQYLPARAQAVRQKIAEVSDNKTGQGMDQLTYLTQQGTSNNLLNTAASARPEMRDRLYQQAAFKALDEGSADRARQIANDHLDPDRRGAVLQRIAAEQQVRKTRTEQVEESRQALAAIPDRDRVSLLLHLATEADNPKQFLDEAFGLVTRPATSYRQIEDQLQVAQFLGASEPQRSFDLLESGINKLNALVSAAAALNGFEVNMFKSDEMPLPGGSQLGAVVIRYGQELAILAPSDFGRAVAAADQFQYPESRLFARLSIVQAVLSKK